MDCCIPLTAVGLPTCADMCNRVIVAGQEWLGPEGKAAFSATLCTANRKYPFWKQYG